MLLSFFFCLVLLDHRTLALTFNDKCTKKCDLPGLTCTSGQCKCDVKTSLFWTGSRCAPCPKDWKMTETTCITLYETEMKWEPAKLACRKVQAELVSFRNRDIIPLIFNVIRSRNLFLSSSRGGVWTSARATNFTGFGEYRWLDESIKPFNNQSDWWCRKSTKGLGYSYQYDEPTRVFRSNGEIEQCVIFWPGINNTQVLCLDDQVCSHQYMFMCEKSESTAVQYLGPPPKETTQLNPSVNNSVNTGIPSITNPPPEEKSLGLGMVITGIIVLVLLLVLLCGGCIYYKRRNAKRTPPDRDRPKQVTHAISKSDISDNESILKDDSTVSPIEENDIPPVLDKVPPIIGGKDQAKTKRGGYSKQQFDEFEGN